MSNNLGISREAEAQTNPHIPQNDAAGEVDALLSAGVAIGVTSSNAYTVTDDELDSAMRFTIGNGGTSATAAFVISLPASSKRGLTLWINTLAYQATIQKTGGQSVTAPLVAAASWGLIDYDGTNARLLTAGAGSGATLADGDYGDIVVSSSGTVLTIDNGAVSLAKQANMATASVVYRKTAGSGAPEVNTLSTLKTDLGLTGTNSGDQSVFSTVAVSGQSNVVADSTSDTLTFAAGTNITITTSAGSDTVTISAASGGTTSASSEDYKDSVRVRVTSVTLAAPGATLDGVSMSSTEPDRFFLDNDAATAGIYDWNGAAVPATRSTDADVDAEVTSGMIVNVTEGSSAGSLWQLTTADPITLNTTALNFDEVSAPASVQLTNQIVNYSAFTADNLNIALAHQDKLLRINNGANNVTVTIGTGLMANNAVFGVMRIGSGTITLVASGTTINTPGSVLTIPRYSTAVLQRRSSVQWDQRYPLFEIGLNVQAYDAELAQIAALAAPGADRVLFWDHSALAFTFLTMGSNLTITGTTLSASVTGATLADGDYGDITASGSGTVLTIDTDVVTYAKMQNVSATDKLLGRSTAGSGDVEEIACTAFGRSLIDDAAAINARTTLGLVIGTDVRAQAADTESFVLACSDETTALTAGTAKVTFRMPYAFTVTAVRASVTTAPTGGTLLAVDINESGTTILSTKLTFDASEKTTTTAATPAVISDSALADDAEITIDIDAVGSTIAGAGLKVYIIGHQ